MIIYLEASALVKRYVEEQGSEQLRRLLNRQSLVATAAITSVELAAALTRGVRGQRLSQQEADLIWQSFQNEWNDFIQVSVGSKVIHQAIECARTYGLRGYDAVHLAAAQFCVTNLVENTLSVVMATFDQELHNAARQAGLDVYPSNL
ncbi:MAG: type II toxin-antitoxin system VapC family toxin [Gemmataceae bacterium]|nr:type II toxin-antitoxin system VapC family toxin [Gemmataceae bacterium]MDW8243710.1 type II toxin-antitoxin system VapC family toxin [Thermogemmata sp.]